MIEIRELGNREIEQFLETADYGHLACCDANGPYVVPIHFAYRDGYVYVYTTQGKKSDIISRQPRVCLQVEDVKDNQNWTSVIIFGEAQILTDESERSRAIEAVASINPTLTPAVAIRWMDNWVRENIEVILRMVPLETTGRASVPKSEINSPFVQSKLPHDSNRTTN
jgi:nitroimidazol reductase NimA-like FMN-containing flavoprotein (pyridoxamine 5'-phosphate oxidase superfamily)